jgi:Fe-S-cluster containining protein
MDSPCVGCEAPCCSGRVVPLGDDEVARIAALLGVAPASFSEPGEGGAGARLRQRGSGDCVFAIEVGATRRCAIHADKPRACRLYPYHIAIDEGGQWTAALGNDYACPPPRGEAWLARLDDERATIEAAIAEHAGDAPRRLPVVDESPCFGCTTSCCSDYLVAVNAHDLWRLTRELGLPWTALAAVRSTLPDYAESFALDDSGGRFGFHLHRTASGACTLLTRLGDGVERCGVHAVRPLACRVYPFQGTWTPYQPIRFVADALCPPPQRARFELKKPELAPEVVQEVGERHRYLRVVRRWDEAARTRPATRPWSVDDYLGWSFALYAAVEELRFTTSFRELARAAAELIAAFPLPDELAPGC